MNYSIKKYLFIPALLLAALTKANTGKDAELRIGDPAPAFKAKWIKGNKLQQLEKGMVYVIEFWATWCGPCIKAMPHVSELAKKYKGKAEFTGVSVWERGKPGQSINSLVEAFVKAKGDTMSYNVYMDESDNYMVKNWVEASGQSSIPATLIVDREGKIAWIGVPTEMDEPLAKIIEGRFDAKAFAESIKKEQERAFSKNRQMEELTAARKPVQAALDAKDYRHAMIEYEKAVSRNVSMARFLTAQYYTALVHLNPEQAFNDAVRVKDSAMQRSTFIHVFSIEDGLDKKFYDYVIDVAEKDPDNFVNWIYASHAYYKAGNTEKAVALLEKFLHWSSSVKTPPPSDYLEKEMQRLKEYKEKLKKY